MDLAFLSAILLAHGAALPATDAAYEAALAQDPRVVVLPGEPPLGEWPGPAAADPAPVAAEQDGDRPEIGPDGEPVIVVSGQETVPGDPIAQINAETFEIMQEVDQALVEPIALAYRDGLPKPIRKGLGNFFANLREPLYFVNFLLQLKPGKAAETLGRFAINSTIGIGGLVDVAKDKPFKLPRRRNGFANTLGYYGVGPGPFLYLPLVGSTTVRDLVGSLADNAFLPTLAGAPFNRIEYGAPAFVVTSLDARIEFDDELQRIRNADEPYASMRETYLEKRRQEIAALHGAPEAPAEPAPATNPGGEF